MDTWLVTGGAGFIGSNFVSLARKSGLARIVNLDKLTYAGNLDSLDRVQGDPDHIFVQGDIGDRALVAGLLATYRPQAIIHFAAESHVDRSIQDPTAFLTTNVLGTMVLLDGALAYWRTLGPQAAQAFRFLQISTDEVFGSLGPMDPPFTETHPFAPNSPYAASKAGADHLVRAYHETHGLPTLTTHCSNNYGPYQYPEKLIPLMILNARRKEALPVYGDGRQVRDWLHVDDHCEALCRVLAKGRPGSVYNIGGNCERGNLDLIGELCAALDALLPAGAPHKDLIKHVTDRPGHDRRYAIDAGKMKRELGWEPRMTLAEGLKKTVDWYLGHDAWVDAVCARGHAAWMETQYANRVAAPAGEGRA